MSATTSLSLPADNSKASGYGTAAVQKKTDSYSITNWAPYQKVFFRIFAIFFVLLSIPNSVAWYDHVLHIDWTSLHYRDLYDIARFGSGINLFGNRLFGSSLQGYANWIITLLISVGLGLGWSVFVWLRKTERAEYNELFYWVRTIVRYRAAIGIIGFAFTKVLPVQMPYPSLGLLNSDFGDLTAQKIYWLSIGIVPWYQVFAGVVELAAGTLLLFRKTTAIGAILLFTALGDIVYVNFAYDGGVHVYSSYFVLLAAFLLATDLPRLYRLLVAEKFSLPYQYVPVFPSWLQKLRVGVKAIIIFVFLFLFFYLQLVNFMFDPYKQPAVKGVSTLRGNYSVDEFYVNGQLVPAVASDTTRWQQVTFEEWSTLSFKVNKPTPLDLSNGGGDPQRDVNRTFEVSGVAGGQRVFHYEADEEEHVLYLQDKFKEVPDVRNRTAGVGGDGGTERNLDAEAAKKSASIQLPVWTEKDWINADARQRIGNELHKIDPQAYSTRRAREYAAAPDFEKRNRMILRYEVSDDGSRVVLNGLGEAKDSIKVVLSKVDRSYLLASPSLKAGKYE